MSSPAAAADASSDRKKPAEQITFRFCSECSNMLYPKEDEVDRKLMFTCRTCNFSEEATSSCIFRNQMNNAVGETAGVTQDVGSDPTVGRPHSLYPYTAVTSATVASESTSPCAQCGRPIICVRCGGGLGTHSTESATAPLGSEEPDMLGLDPDITRSEGDSDLNLDVDLDDVEIVPWTGESLAELGAMLSQTEDFFGLNATDLGLESKGDGINLPSVLQAQLPRSKKNCPACNHTEAVFFQSQQRSTETGMVRNSPIKLFYVCCDCGNIFQ
ncbi:DNA-directed RNA polymerase II subunit RPB9 [Dichotomopilus funicola]|uniref:DNA-directed RNA polymerase II subunit RPB9 n=1 Tax=Dichotomopilus funicola TaxID=1934379 RepID=A0AAN6V1Q4_9PEZI|nr:DNA-directed RNA polymerase II subunit RPB9 [Dichotomopilus funicola]